MLVSYCGNRNTAETKHFTTYKLSLVPDGYIFLTFNYNCKIEAALFSFER